MQPSPSHYRADIDGLRAVAIVPVVLFHLDKTIVPSGFLGVDIFFVISGYLITSILLRENGNSTFRFSRFWMRRIRRLFPALAAMICGTILIGYFTLFGDEWKSTAFQSLAALASVGNFFMWRKAGDYWGESADTMPMLHTWSLSVEEQFYLIFPVVLFLIFRKSNRLVLPVLLVTALGSFLASSYAVLHHPSAEFYLLPTRAWEMMLGGILASLGSRIGSPPCPSWRSLAGLVAIVIAMSALDSGSGFTLQLGRVLVCVGTFLVIAFPSTGLVERLLSVAPMVFLGKISYSLYLWHWPVIVIGRHIGGLGNTNLLVVSLVLGWLSFALVEQRTRFLSTIAFRRTAIGMAFCLCLCLSLPFWVERNAIAFEPPKFQSGISLQPSIGKGHFDESIGTFKTGLVINETGPNDPIDVLILGDSHSLMFFPAIQRCCEDRALTLCFYGADGGTSPFFVQNNPPEEYYHDGWEPAQRLQFDECRKSFLKARKPQVVFVCANWYSYGQKWEASRLESHLEYLAEQVGDSILVFVGQPPVLPFGQSGFLEGKVDTPLFRGFEESERSTAARTRSHSQIKALCGKDEKRLFLSLIHI